MNLIRTPDKVIAVVGGDHHMHPWPQYNDVSTSVFGSRIDRSLESLAEGAEAACFYEVPLIINGDLMHTKNSIPPHVLLALRGHFHRYEDVYHFINTGNHERPDKSGITTLDILNEFNNVLVYSTPAPVLLPIDESRPDVYTNQVAVVMLPWTYEPAGFIKDAKAEAQVARETGVKHVVLLAHYPVCGAKLGTGTTLNEAPGYESFLPEHYDLLLFNDIHKQQPVGDKGYHLGATHANSFSDADYDCHWWLLGVDASGPCIWPVKTKISGFKIATTEDEADQLTEAGHFTKINIEASIQKQVTHAELPRIATATDNLADLIDGYFTANNGYKLDLTPEEVQCAKERITWAINQAKV